MANAQRLVEVGIVPEAAKEIANQINSASFTPAASQADSAASDVASIVADFNDLLAKLKAAGLMA